MDPEGSLLERNPEKTTPIAKDAGEILDMRDEFRKIEYSREVLKASHGELPTTVRELREALDRKAQDIAANDKTEADHNKAVPDRVLRKEDERWWTEIGWNREKREIVIQKLKEVLGVSSDNAENIIHMLVAAGKDPDSVLIKLSDDKYTNRNNPEYYLVREEFFDPEYGGAQKVENLAAAKIQNRYVSQLDRETANKYLLLHDELGLKELDHVNNHNTNNHIMRFGLDDEFRSSLDYEFDTDLPQNLFDVAWNIMYHNQEKFGLHGTFPILQMQVKRDTQTGKVIGGRYVVNQGNYMRWLRDRMWERYDAFETDEVADYYSVVNIHKGQYSTVNLATMIFDKTRYFRDETGHAWDQLYNEVFIEPFDLIFDRTYGVEHQKAYDKGDDFAKIWEQWARLSKFTRKINGQSMLDRAMMLSVDHKGKDSDARLGEAILQMFLGYYYLADFDQLKKVLGEDSEFFTRQGWIKAAADFEGGGTTSSGGIKATGIPFTGEYFGEHQHYFDEAFNEDGSIKNKNNFLLFINPNYHEYPSQNLEKVLAQMLQNTVKEKFRSKDGKKDEQGNEPIDLDSLKYAWLKAYSWIGFSGARARNNFKPEGSPSGHNQETRLLHTDAYRMKYETFGGAGNLYTVPMFKQLSTAFFEGTLSETATTDYIVGMNPDGTPKYNSRARTQMEVMLDLRQNDLTAEKEREEVKKIFDERIGQSADENEKNDLRGQLARRLTRIDDYYKHLHKQYANQLEFNDNAMLVFAKNVIGMANPLYDRVMKAKETDFDKFITYDGIFRGPSFNREAWQDAMQSKLFTPLRYIFEANGGTQLNQIVRAPVYMGRDSKGKAKWEWKDQYLGERMIGHQVLDIEHFWKKADEMPKEDWEVLKSRGFRKRRGYVIRPDGRHEIDYNKVQDNKPMVYKQWMLMKLAADLWAHIDRHSSDPTYTLEHYDNIVDAIKNLSGDITGDQYNMKGVRNNKALFNKHQIEWLERISGKNGLFFRTFVQDIFMGDKRKKESLFGESTNIILGAIFKG